MTDLVVVGLGYVGLPLVHEACAAGMTVAGLDTDPRTVNGLNDGVSHVDDLSDANIQEMLQAGFKATNDPSIVQGAKAVVICVPTPLSETGGPDLTAVRSASEAVGANLHRGALIVLESTTYPGTTRDVVARILEAKSGLRAGTDFLLAYSPERIDPGNRRFTLRTTPKIVGGDSPEETRAAADFYGNVCDTVVCAVGTREAEAAKLLENTYRHVNIALVNEMAQFLHEMGIDFWNVLDLAATKPFGFQAFRPGPGVGGHCIPIDPNYLGHQVRSQLGYAFRFVELAQEINAGMPAYVVRRAAELLNAARLPLNGSRVLLLGVTYKADIADQRESPARDVASRMLKNGATVFFHDPFVEEWDIPGVSRVIGDLGDEIADFDLVILLQAHSAYEPDELARAASIFLDTRGATSAGLAERL